MAQDAPRFEVDAGGHNVARHADDRVHEGCEFLDLDRLGVRSENNVLPLRYSGNSEWGDSALIA